MEKFWMKKRKFKLVLAIVVIIFIIVLIFPKNKSLSYRIMYCPKCDEEMNLARNDQEHIYICPNDGYSIYERHHGGERHTGEIGRCIICDMAYIRHEMEFLEYRVEENGHIRVERCNMYNIYNDERIGICGETREYYENHTGGTHENNGKCTVCGYQYQKHNKTDNIVGYDTNRKWA